MSTKGRRLKVNRPALQRPDQLPGERCGVTLGQVSSARQSGSLVSFLPARYKNYVAEFDPLDSTCYP